MRDIVVSNSTLPPLFIFYAKYSWDLLGTVAILFVWSCVSILYAQDPTGEASVITVGSAMNVCLNFPQPGFHHRSCTVIHSVHCRFPTPQRQWMAGILQNDFSISGYITEGNRPKIFGQGAPLLTTGILWMFLYERGVVLPLQFLRK